MVRKQVTITPPEEAANRDHAKATGENTSVSRIGGRMPENQTLHSDAYAAAYQHWKERPSWDLDAANRVTREEAHERR